MIKRKTKVGPQLTMLQSREFSTFDGAKVIQSVENGFEFQS